METIAWSGEQNEEVRADASTNVLCEAGGASASHGALATDVEVDAAVVARDEVGDAVAGGDHDGEEYETRSQAKSR